MNKSKFIMHYKKIFVFGTLLVAIGLFFQNCSQDVSFQEIPSIVDTTAGGSCVRGDKLAVYLDPDQSGTLKSENFMGYVVSYSGAETAYKNYNYFSASAHPIVGPVPLDYLLNVFFYKQVGTEQLALTVFANKDTSGGPGSFETKIITTANSSHDGIVLVDDPASPSDIFSQAPIANGKLYEFSLHYTDNTDGFVIGPFDQTGYKIQVQIPSSSNVNQGRFYSADGSSFKIKDDVGISSFVITAVGIETCE